MYGTLISTITVGAGGAASIDFTSIPQTYKDLFIVLSARATSTTATISMTVNGGGVSNRLYIRGNGSATSTSTTGIIGNASISTDTASTFGSATILIPNYSATSFTKHPIMEVISENNATSANAFLVGGTFTSSAITQVTFSLANFAQYSSASVYGISSGSGGSTVSST